MLTAEINTEKTVAHKEVIDYSILSPENNAVRLDGKVSEYNNPNVKFKASFCGCSLEDREKFKTSRCILPISIGQIVHEGQKFKAHMALIDRSFHSCTVLVDDTIQRHTLKILYPNLDEQTLIKHSIVKGDEWLQRNQITLSHNSIQTKVIRWDYWRNHPLFAEKLHLVQERLNNDPHYRQSFNEAINIFLDRFYNKAKLFGKECDTSNAHSYCMDYMIEECAVMLLWAEEKYDYEVYCSGRNEAMATTFDLLIKPNSDLLRFASIRFKKNQK